MIQADLVERFLVATVLLNWIEDNLLALVVLSGKGKKRALYSAYASQLDRVTRLAQVLGVERRQRTADGLEAVRRAVEEASRDHHPAPDDRLGAGLSPNPGSLGARDDGGEPTA